MFSVKPTYSSYGVVYRQDSVIVDWLVEYNLLVSLVNFELHVGVKRDSDVIIGLGKLYFCEMRSFWNTFFPLS